MYEKCITCDIIGVSCVPNLMRMQFSDIIQWCIKRQKYLGWTNQFLADKSAVPVGTINRIKAGDYLDCKYSTIKNLLVALIGGTTDEFPCNKQVEKELQQMEALEQQAAKLAAVEAENVAVKAENEALKAKLDKIDEQHRMDILVIKEQFIEQKKDYQERIEFLKEQLKAWQSR